MTDLPGRWPPPADPPPAVPPEGRYRIMVVDDSAVARGFLTRALESDPELSVAASVRDGAMAVNALARQPVDVILLDVEMPVMDGLTAIPKLLAVRPEVRIIMASTLTRRGAEISMTALRLGAVDFIAKPSSTRELVAAESFKSELIDKVKAWALTRAWHGRGSYGPERPGQPMERASPAWRRPTTGTGEVVLRPMPPALSPAVVAIGSSIGGPQALVEVLSHLRGGLPQPILVTQHMPVTFTTMLADHIARHCGLACAEARDGEPLEPGRVYLAPGDRHMTVKPAPGGGVVSLNQDPPENFCRPAVDPMLRSIARTFGGRSVVAILTGMGQDGTRGCREIAAAGGVVLAQDEATSIVWGMPGAAVAAGVCSAVLPLGDIGPAIRRLARHEAA